mgnify:FL=1
MGQVALAQIDTLFENLEDVSDEQLDVLERKIASKYMGIVPWGAVVWGIGNCLVFISLFPLVLLDIVSLWIAFPIATLLSLIHI